MSSLANAFGTGSSDAGARRGQTIIGAPLPMVSMEGITVLVVEDEFLIALEASALLSERGAAHVITARTSAEALSAIAEGAVGLAVLDINLDAEQSIAVADALAERKVPFVFATGYSDSAMLPPHHQTVPVVRKPYDQDDLMAAIEAAVAAKGASGDGDKPAK